MSGMEPVRLKDGGFPDLTGDGKVTQKDILRGRGIEGFADGGEAQGLGSRIFEIGSNMANWATENPLDAAAAGLMFVPMVGWGTSAALKGLQLASKANTLRKTKKGMDAVSKLTNTPKTNKAGLGALIFDAGKNPEEYGFGEEESYTDPSVAYLNEDNGKYYYYDPEKDDYDYFQNNQVPEGYTLEQ